MCPTDHKVVEGRTAPKLDGTETPFEFGYASLIVAGAQGLQSSPPGGMKHLEVLKFLLSRGLPPDSEDIVGITALQHVTCCTGTPRLDLGRLLLQSGADVNHQNRYGEVALCGAFQTNAPPSIDLLMEFGADLNVADADDVTPMSFFMQCGPQVTATVQKWIRERSGETAFRGEKQCDRCGRDDVALKNCARCHVVRYCGAECQREFDTLYRLSSVNIGLNDGLQGSIGPPTKSPASLSLHPIPLFYDLPITRIGR
jgi:hypothetical protein